MAARKIIIDTDPGVDDAMAIFFALSSPELDVIGLTTIFGNVRTDLATINALRLLETARRTDIPVAKGATDPIVGAFNNPAPFVHGDDGQGNVFLPPPSTEPLPEPAAEFIVDQVMAFPGEITLVPIGPLTNIALALRLEPKIAHQVREVVLMGGNAFVPGLATPAAEPNIHNDPEAADIVFSADWPVTMVGLDVTQKVIMSPEHLNEYARHETPVCQHIARILPFYQNFSEQDQDIRGIHVHDSTAIAYLLLPEAFRTERWQVRVEMQGFSRGKTWPQTGGDPDKIAPWAGRREVNVCVAVDAARTINLELERLTG